MGEGSRAVRALLGGLALVLTAGCGVGTSAAPVRPAPSTYASLTTTGPEDLGLSRKHEYVDPSVAEPPGGRADSENVFVWSRQTGPSTPFGAVDADTLERLIDTDLTDAPLARADMAVALTLGTPDQARAAARRVRADLPGTATRYDTPRDAVVVLGSTLVVRGIQGAAPMRAVRGLLSGYPGEVLVEGDRYGEGAIVTDLSCRPEDPTKAHVVAADLHDFAGTSADFFLRPPWARPPITSAERLARSTYTRFYDALELAAAADPETQELWFHYRRALRAGDMDRLERVQGRITERRRELSPARLEGAYDPRTLASLRTEPLEPDARPRWAARVGRRMGQLPITERGGELVLTEGRHLSANPTLLSVRLEDRLDVSMFLPIGRFAPSLASLVVYLDRVGCADVRYRPLDWDTVRAD